MHATLPVLTLALLALHVASEGRARHHGEPSPGMRAVAAARSVVPDTVELLAPPNGATVSVDSLLFTWRAVTGASWYDVSFSLSADFASHLDTSHITATSLVMRGIPSGRTVFWRVRAADQKGAGAWCAVRSVTTRAGGTGGAPDSVKPLTELGTGTYRGFGGGLYSNGANVPPERHLADGLGIAGTIVPLSAAGVPDPANGRIVLLSVGMSNTTQEFSRFKTMADTFAGKNPRVTVVDGAQGGQTASIIAVPTANFWSVIDQRLQAAGVTAAQVQAVWLKEANAGPTNGFPQYALDLQRDLAAIVRLMAARYPNLRIVYLSSRIYGGYATTMLNPEMYAYESGFSVKWLIEAQIAGDTSLAYDGPNRRAPWLAWGPYLWANGLHPRADGLVWEATDFAADGTHPGPTGQTKVATLLLNFLQNDPTARPWFLRPAIGGAPGPAAVSGLTISCYPNPSAGRITIAYNVPRAGRVRLEIVDAMGRVAAVPVDGVRSEGAHDAEFVPLAEGIPAGIYLARLRVGESVRTTGFVVLR